MFDALIKPISRYNYNTRHLTNHSVRNIAFYCKNPSFNAGDQVNSILSLSVDCHPIKVLEQLSELYTSISNSVIVHKITAIGEDEKFFADHSCTGR